MVTLSNPILRVQIAQEGGSIRNFEVLVDGVWEQLFVVGEPGLAPCFPLVPFASRIRNATLTWAGRTHALEPSLGFAPHAIHGHGWRVGWQVVKTDETSVVHQYTHQSDAAGWPWSYRAEQAFVLEDDALTVSLFVQNLSEAPMPAGLGLHPYFRVTEEMQVKMSLSRRWQMDEEVFPVVSEALPEDMNFAEGIHPTTMAVDAVFEGWDGEAQVDWSDLGVCLELKTDPVLEHVVVYTPGNTVSDDPKFVCVEPVTHLTDAFNIMGLGGESHGTRVLEPGETFTLTVAFRVRLDENAES